MTVPLLLTALINGIFVNFPALLKQEKKKKGQKQEQEKKERKGTETRAGKEGK